MSGSWWNQGDEGAREEVWALVAVMVGVGAFGTGAGYFLDGRLNTGPWLLVVGALIGMGTGLFLALRMASAYASQEKPRLGRE